MRNTANVNENYIWGAANVKWPRESGCGKFTLTANPKAQPENKTLNDTLRAKELRQDDVTSGYVLAGNR